jgi:hypothetical protein
MRMRAAGREADERTQADRRPCGSGGLLADGRSDQVRQGRSRVARRHRSCAARMSDRHRGKRDRRHGCRRRMHACALAGAGLATVQGWVSGLRRNRCSRGFGSHRGCLIMPGARQRVGCAGGWCRRCQCGHRVMSPVLERHCSRRPVEGRAVEEHGQAQKQTQQDGPARHAAMLSAGCCIWVEDR